MCTVCVCTIEHVLSLDFGGALNGPQNISEGILLVENFVHCSLQTLKLVGWGRTR